MNKRSLFQRLISLCVLTIIAAGLTTGCSKPEEKIKATGSSTYYEGPIKNEKKKTTE